MFHKIALIGIGLIGSSLAHNIRYHKLSNQLYVFDYNQEHAKIACELGLNDAPPHISLEEALDNADLVILATPMGSYTALSQKICTSITSDTIIIDVGSVKQTAMKAFQPYLTDHICFIPCHPIAGTEHSGPQAGFRELFQNRWCIITPFDHTPQDMLDKVLQFWQTCGMKTEIMSAAHHDLVLAITSHLPHLIAYSVVGTANDLELHLKSEVIKFSAGGFRDFTRIAASNPTMWRDIFLDNKTAVLEVLGRFSEDLAQLQKAIRWDDGDFLFEHFTKTRRIRQSIIEEKQAD